MRFKHFGPATRAVKSILYGPYPARQRRKNKKTDFGNLLKRILTTPTNKSRLASSFPPRQGTSPPQ